MFIKRKNAFCLSSCHNFLSRNEIILTHNKRYNSHNHTLYIASGTGSALILCHLASMLCGGLRRNSQ